MCALVLRLVTMFLCCLIAYSASGQETLYIATGEYPPWTSKKLKYHGYVNHIIQEAFKREGYVVEFKYFPWARAYKEASSGKYQATSYWYYSKERENSFYYSDSIVIEDTVLFHRKSMKFEWDNLDDLKSYKLGVTRGYSYNKEFWDAEKSKLLNVEIVNSDKQNLEKLIRNRIDIVLLGRIAGLTLFNSRYELNNENLIVFHSKPLIRKSGHLLFSKNLPNSKHLITVFNKGLSKLKSEGVLKQFEKDLINGGY